MWGGDACVALLARSEWEFLASSRGGCGEGTLASPFLGVNTGALFITEEGSLLNRYLKDLSGKRRIFSVKCSIKWHNALK
jgi:hypothetical protein